MVGVKRGMGVLMNSELSPPVVTQLRLVVAADDFDEAVGFYRDVRG